ncbi:MAG TPA: glycosyltransferase [Thermoanaerobaculia bacterium]|nr:glycosyltransferase [Thermoanaerobaculia bacterium]
MTGPLSRVRAIVVSWNSAGHVGRAVASVPPPARVVVVDNASTDGSASEAERAGAVVLRLESNAGFGPACNLGAGPVDGLPDAETLLFLNPDAALVDGPAALAALLAELDADPAVAAVAPALEGDGQEEFQLRRLPTLGSLAREAFLVNRLFASNRGFRGERYLDRDRSEPFDVEQPAAAALLVRREAFERVGGFDPAFAPAWFEDVDLSAKLLESGYRIRFVPAARASHVGGTTMRALPYDDYLPLYTRNLIRYLGRHSGPATRAGARSVLAVGALLRLVLLPFVRGDHARPEAARAYVRVLRGLLGLGFRSALLPGGA